MATEMAISPSKQTEKKPANQRLLMWNISSSLADSLFAWSNILLVTGAAAVLIGTIGAIKMGAVREYFADIRISENERETKRSIADSDLAKEAAAKANAAASQAQLELVKLKAPRSLTDEQVQHIRARMTAFPAQPFGMITYWRLDEPTAYAKRIGEDALIKAGWHFIQAERFEAIIGVVTGIEVQIADDADAKFKEAAKELVAALAEVDPSATLVSEPAYKTLIKIQIGMKP